MKKKRKLPSYAEVFGNEDPRSEKVKDMLSKKALVVMNEVLEGHCRSPMMQRGAEFIGAKILYPQADGGAPSALHLHWHQVQSALAKAGIVAAVPQSTAPLLVEPKPTEE